MHFKLVVLFLDLLLLGLLLVLVIHVVNIGVAEQIVSLPLFRACGDFPLLIVIVDVHLVHGDVELCLFDLVGGGKVRVQLELLSHLIDQHVLIVVVFGQLDGGLEDL